MTEEWRISMKGNKKGKLRWSKRRSKRNKI